MKNLGVRIWARLVGAMMLLIAAMTFGASPAQAHDVVASSSPEANSEVTEFPEEILLTFSGQIQPDFNAVAVTNQDTGELLFDAEPTLDGFDVIVPVPEGLDTPAGTYLVGYQITSSDGHATRGSFSFTLVGDEAETTTSSTTTAETASSNDASSNDTENTAEESNSGDDGVRAWVIIFAVIAIAAILFAVVAIAMRSSSSKNQDK